MCHHYVGQKANREFLEAAFHVRSNLHQLSLPEGHFYPLKSVPIVRLDADGERELAVCEWGILPAWWKPKAAGENPQKYQKTWYNARAETVDVKPVYRSAFKSRRCLVPASMFEEKKHMFRFADERPFAFAGLWEKWRGAEGEIETCAFLTAEPNEEVRGVGHHRMPVILSSEAEYSRWLDPEIVERGPLDELMRPLQDGSLAVEAIGTLF
jgi:putative SOS response-associated peptidase YedK